MAAMAIVTYYEMGVTGQFRAAFSTACANVKPDPAKGHLRGEHSWSN
jgi:hypothetical protein